MTGWGMTWVGASCTSVEPVWKSVLNCQNLAIWFSYIAIWWINSKVPEGSMIIIKSRLNSTGHSACTSEVHDIFDRQTYVPNEWWQLICSNVLQPWDRRISSTVPVRNITERGQHTSNRVSGLSTRKVHQSTTPSLSQTIWPRWPWRQILTLPTVQILLPVTFGYSLSSRKNLETVVMRQLRR